MRGRLEMKKDIHIDRAVIIDNGSILCAKRGMENVYLAQFNF